MNIRQKQQLVATKEELEIDELAMQGPEVTEVSTDLMDCLENINAVTVNQFVFDCGAVLGNHLIKEDRYNVALAHHKKTTNSVDEFIESVREFIEMIDGAKLTTNDVSRLKSEYSLL